MIFKKIAQELNANQKLQNCYAMLSDLVNSIETNKAKYLLHGENYQALINPILNSFKKINSSQPIFFKNTMMAVLQEIHKFFNNKQIRKNPVDLETCVKITNELKSA